MPPPRFADDIAGAIPLHVVTPEALDAFAAARPEGERRWLAVQGFRAGAGEALILPGPDGSPVAAVAGLGDEAARRRERFVLAGAAGRLPPGTYRLAEPAALPALAVEALGWLLAGYRFDRYRREGEGKGCRLVCPEGLDRARLEAVAEAVFLGQDLINTPASDLGPAALEAACADLAAAHGARIETIRGEALLKSNLPMIHAVGRAAAEAPRLVDLRWGPEDAPKVTLVGKGVCFDTGGLNIKPSNSMGLMKKDMGGAATVLALGRMVMALDLPIRLRILVPAVENAISGGAMRPGDILRSRKGLSVEVNNTDAEGRLVLADALALACEEAPDLVVSLATLTGAARVALGPDLPPFFTDDEPLARALAEAAAAEADPLWRLPFWPGYESMIEPGIADLDNAPSGGMAGAITAALFLRRFVSAPYLHLDLYGWTPQAKPGRPKGGAIQGARAILAVLEARFCRN
jgi:leucyl aminopeptidase